MGSLFTRFQTYRNTTSPPTTTNTNTTTHSDPRSNASALIHNEPVASKYTNVSPEERVQMYLRKREAANKRVLDGIPKTPVKIWVQQEALRVFLSSTFEILTRVPQEVVLYIFSYLNKFQMKQVSLVCRDFHRLIKMRIELDKKMAPKPVWKSVRPIHQDVA